MIDPREDLVHGCRKVAGRTVRTYLALTARQSPMRATRWDPDGRPAATSALPSPLRCWALDVAGSLRELGVAFYGPTQNPMFVHPAAPAVVMAAESGVSYREIAEVVGLGSTHQVTQILDTAAVRLTLDWTARGLPATPWGD